MKTKQLAQRKRHISVNSKAARRRRLRIECLEDRRLLAAPTLDTIPNITVAEDSFERTINLTGITAGDNETQPLRVTATSNNVDLIPASNVSYVSPESTGILKFKPLPDLSGVSVITVTVEDGGQDGDLATLEDNLSFSRSFTVTVIPVNDSPTINTIADLTIEEDALQQTVDLTGISAGGGESQPIRVSATSDRPSIIPNPAVTYTSDQTTGTLTFTPKADAYGIATITIRVEDGGLDTLLSTTGDNGIQEVAFDVIVLPLNDSPTLDPFPDLTIPEDSQPQVINLSGLTAGPSEYEDLRISLSSSNPSLIPTPTLGYSSTPAGPAGLLGFHSELVNVIRGTTNKALIRLVRSPNAVGTAVVDFYTVDGSAKSGVDYDAISATLTFADGQLSKEIVIPLSSSNATEAKSFSVHLANPSTGVTLGLTQTTINIQPNGSNPNDGKMLELLLTARSKDDQPLPKQADGKIAVPVGEPFHLEVAYDDLRVNQFLQPAVELGVFQLITDVAVSQPGVLMPILRETQQLIIDKSVITEFGNNNIQSFEFSIPEAPPGVTNAQLTYTSLAADFGGNPVAAVTYALQAFGYTTGQFEINTLDFGTGGDIGYQIHWTDEEFGNVDLPNVSVDVIEVNSATEVPTETIEYAAFLADGATPNPDAVRFNLNTYSRTFNPTALNPSGEKFYASQNRGTFDPATGFDQVGGLGLVPLDGGGVPDLTDDGSFDQPFDAFSLPVYLKFHVGDLTVSVNPAEHFDSPLLYGRDAPLPLEFVLTEEIDTNSNGTSSVSFKTLSDIPDQLFFSPVADETGETVITVVVEDAGLDNDFSTITDNESLTRSFVITVEASPSVAKDDSYAWSANSESVFTVSRDELLANDIFGHGETSETVTITTDSTTRFGGTVTFEDDTFTYTRPSEWFFGVDSFQYLLDDGGSSSIATVTIFCGVEGDQLTIKLNENQDNTVILRITDSVLVMEDLTANEILLNIPVADLPPNIRVLGATNKSNSVTFDSLENISSSERRHYWYLEGGETTDHATVIGTLPSWAWISSDPLTSGDLVLDVKQPTNLLGSYSFASLESVEIGEFGRIQFESPSIRIGSDQLYFGSDQPLVLPDETMTSGGKLTSEMPVVLESGHSILGNGTIDAPIAANLGSLIRSNGTMFLGKAGALDGFRSDGRMDLGGNTTHLLDANQAELGILTTIGKDKPGYLRSDNGFILDFGDNLTGFGKIESLPSGTIINNGVIKGDSEEKPITIEGTVKGVGTFDNVVMNGDFKPGFSPALWSSGTVVYGNENRLEIEIGGEIAGLGFDRVEHYKATLGGTLDVRLINGFAPKLGSEFEVLTSELPLLGDFSAVLLPETHGGIPLKVIVDNHRILVEPYVKLDESVDSGGVGNSSGFGSLLEVVQSTNERYQIRSGESNLIDIDGPQFRIEVGGKNEFLAPARWHIERTLIENDALVQIASDGVNKLIIDGSGWRNFVTPSDINKDGGISALDALVLINELRSRVHSDHGNFILGDPKVIFFGEGHFYDQNGDGKCTALDALRVINDLARSTVSGEGESVTTDYLSQGSASIGSPGTASYSEPFESKLEETELLYSDAAPEASRVSDRPEDLVYATTGQEGTEAVDSLLRDLEDWWK